MNPLDWLKAIGSWFMTSKQAADEEATQVEMKDIRENYREAFKKKVGKPPPSSE